MAFLYVFLGGSRDGETMTSAEHAISTFTTREGRYFVDDPPNRWLPRRVPPSFCAMSTGASVRCLHRCEQGAGHSPRMGEAFRLALLVVLVFR